jgi:hypothetical protein
MCRDSEPVQPGLLDQNSISAALVICWKLMTRFLMTSEYWLHAPSIILSRNVNTSLHSLPPLSPTQPNVYPSLYTDVAPGVRGVRASDDSAAGRRTQETDETDGACRTQSAAEKRRQNFRRKTGREDTNWRDAGKDERITFKRFLENSLSL